MTSDEMKEFRKDLASRVFDELQKEYPICCENGLLGQSGSCIFFTGIKRFGDLTAPFGQIAFNPDCVYADRWEVTLKQTRCTEQKICYEHPRLVDHVSVVLAQNGYPVNLDEV